jgi:hypothetical protein
VLTVRIQANELALAGERKLNASFNVLISFKTQGTKLTNILSLWNLDCLSTGDLVENAQATSEMEIS